MKITICPGSSDPATFGHLDITNCARKIFDHLTIVVLVNPNKHTNFTVEGRINMLKHATADMPSIGIVGSEGLLVDYAKIRNTAAIVKGLQALSDFECRFQIALTSEKLSPSLGTLFLTAQAGSMYLSSGIVKQIASFGGDTSDFVSECILDNITQCFYTGGRER